MGHPGAMKLIHYPAHGGSSKIAPIFFLEGCLIWLYNETLLPHTAFFIKQRSLYGGTDSIKKINHRHFIMSGFVSRLFVSDKMKLLCLPPLVL